MNISFFDNYTSRNPKTATLSQMVDMMRDDKRIKSITAAYRQTDSKRVKGESPLFAVAATFYGGKSRKHINGITGLSLVDVDHVGQLDVLREKIIADPHTVLCYTTISGKGLRVIFRYESHKEESLKKSISFYPKAFATGNAYYSRLLGVETDGQCKNITRLSGLAHDADAFLNPDAVAFTAEECLTTWECMISTTRDSKQERRIMNYYNKIIKPKLDGEGIVYAPGSHNNYVMRVGYMIAGKRYSLQAAINWAREQFSDYDDVEQVFRSCYNSIGDSGHHIMAAPVKTASVNDIKTFLNAHISLRFNTITGRVEHADNSSEQSSWQPVTDRVVNSIWMNMSNTQRVNVCDIFRVMESDYVKSYDPFSNYLRSLAPWNNGDHDHIGDLAATVTIKKYDNTEDLTFVCALRRWLVGMVAAWIDNTVVNNVILVLIGEQGAYKTTWFQYLLPPELRQYFYTKTNANRMTKDDLLTLAQYGLVCCEELDTMRPAELNQLKAAITMPSIDERAAYARFNEHRQHIASFCGTGNNAMFLSDPTGNRRWLPFEVESIVSPREQPFNYAGIYAQALTLYKAGFRFWFTREEIKQINSHNRHFEAPQMEMELVTLYFRLPNPGESPMFMTSARALQIVGTGVAQKLSATRIGMAFSERGFERVRHQGVRGFLVIMRSAEEMTLFQKSV